MIYNIYLVYVYILCVLLDSADQGLHQVTIYYLHYKDYALVHSNICNLIEYKANLRDLIAATGLVILLKLDWNRRFFACVTLKFDGWPRKIIRYVFYTTSSFVYHWWIQTGVTVRKRPIWVKFDDFLSRVTL